MNKGDEPSQHILMGKSASHFKEKEHGQPNMFLMPK